MREKDDRKEDEERVREKDDRKEGEGGGQGEGGRSRDEKKKKKRQMTQGCVVCLHVLNHCVTLTFGSY